MTHLNVDPLSAFLNALAAREKTPTRPVLTKTAIPFVEEIIDTRSMAFRGVDTALVPVPTDGTIPEPTITLNPDQQKAIDTAMASSYSCLIGPAGSGKTTTIKELIRRTKAAHHDPEKFKVALCAFTNKATGVIRDSVGEEFSPYCLTMHKLLGFAPKEVEVPPSEKDISNGWDPCSLISKRLFRPEYTWSNQYDYDLIIVDEASMIGLTTLWKWFVAALPPHCRLVLVGDLNQLPPVMDKGIFAFAMSRWPVTELRTIYRQEKGSLIDNYEHIREGKIPVESPVWKMIPLPDQSAKARDTIIGYITAAVAAGWYDPNQDIILGPTKPTKNTGLEDLNIHLRPVFNKGSIPITIETAMGDKSFAPGDRIIIDNFNDPAAGIFNGQAGTILSIDRNAGYRSASLPSEGSWSLDSDAIVAKGEELSMDNSPDNSWISRKASHTLEILFEGMDYPSYIDNASQISGIILGWAITGYKSQGSGYRKVISLMHHTHGQGLFREQLYTMTTRAREEVALLYSPRGLKTALSSVRMKGKDVYDKVANYLEKPNNARLALEWTPTEDSVADGSWAQNISDRVTNLELN